MLIFIQRRKSRLQKGIPKKQSYVKNIINSNLNIHEFVLYVGYFKSISLPANDRFQ